MRRAVRVLFFLLDTQLCRQFLEVALLTAGHATEPVRIEPEIGPALVVMEWAKGSIPTTAVWASNPFEMVKNCPKKGLFWTQLSTSFPID